MIPRVLRWIVCIPLLQSSTPVVEPVWPDAIAVASSRPHSNLQLQVASFKTPYRGDASRYVDEDDVDAAVHRAPICIVWTRHWAGALGSTLLYRVQRLAPELVAVGYFAYWTNERPFGDNDLTHWILPAVAIDAVYSHLLFVLPGLQRLMYGPGDIEGMRVVYRVEQPGRWLPIAVIADDEQHHEVSIALEDAIDADGRIVMRTDVWSHQLGAPNAASAARQGAWQRCFVGNALRPLTQDVTQAFRLGTAAHPRRAKPAWRLAAAAQPYNAESRDPSAHVGHAVAAFTPGQPIGSANWALQRLLSGAGSPAAVELRQRGL